MIVSILIAKFPVPVLARLWSIPWRYSCRGPDRIRLRKMYPSLASKPYTFIKILSSHSKERDKNNQRLSSYIKNIELEKIQKEAVQSVKRKYKRSSEKN